MPCAWQVGLLLFVLHLYLVRPVHAVVDGRVMDRGRGSSRMRETSLSRSVTVQLRETELPEPKNNPRSIEIEKERRV